MVPIESKEEKEMTKTKIYDTAFYEAVEFAGDCLTVKKMNESMYDYIFNNENPFDKTKWYTSIRLHNNPIFKEYLTTIGKH